MRTNPTTQENSATQPPEGSEIVFMVSSGFGGNTNRPYVQVLIEAADWMTQMPPEKARDLAHNLLGAADAAESDGFLVTFLRQRVKAGDEAIAQILIEFREWRREQQ